MAFEDSLRSVTLNADASLAVRTGVAGQAGSVSPAYGKMFRFVKVTGTRQCGQATAATDAVVGVLQSKPQVANQAATVGLRGISNVMTGGTFVAGDALTSDANGKAIKTTTGNVMAIALAASTGSDQIVPALLKLAN